MSSRGGSVLGSHESGLWGLPRAVPVRLSYILLTIMVNIYRPFSDQNGSKTMPFGTAHNYIADIGEYLPGYEGYNKFSKPPKAMKSPKRTT